MNEQKYLIHRLAVILKNEDDVENEAARETQSKQTYTWFHSCKAEDMDSVCVCMSTCVLSVISEKNGSGKATWMMLRMDKPG